MEEARTPPGLPRPIVTSRSDQIMNGTGYRRRGLGRDEGTMGNSPPHPPRRSLGVFTAASLFLLGRPSRRSLPRPPPVPPLHHPPRRRPLLAPLAVSLGLLHLPPPLLNRGLNSRRMQGGGALG